MAALMKGVTVERLCGGCICEQSYLIDDNNPTLPLDALAIVVICNIQTRDDQGSNHWARSAVPGFVLLGAIRPFVPMMRMRHLPYYLSPSHSSR